MSATTVARKKSKAKPAGPHRDELIAIRCTAAYKAHLEGIAGEETRTPTQVIERALKEYAEKHGHKPFPGR